MVLFLTFNLSQTHMNRVFGKQLLLHTKPGTAGVGHMRRQAQQFHVKSAGVGAFHLRLSRMGRQTSPIAQKTLFVPVSKAPVINALKGCPNISPPVREQRLLAFSASSTSRTRTAPPCFLSFISVLSQVQLREPSYTCVQYIKTEALATASSKVQRNREKELPF